LKKANWALFASELQAKEPEALEAVKSAKENNNWEAVAQALTTTITSAADLAIPRLKITKRSKP